MRCGEPVVRIEPHIAVPNPEVYRNIRIEDNEFVLRGTTAVKARGTSGLRVTGNTIHLARRAQAADAIQVAGCADVLTREQHLSPATCGGFRMNAPTPTAIP